MTCLKVILTKKEAVSASKRFGKQRQYRREKRYYYCSICNGWHLTSKEELIEDEPIKLSFTKAWKKFIKQQKKENANNI